LSVVTLTIFFFFFQLGNPVYEMVFGMGNDFLAFHHHINKVVGHVKNGVSAV
jgi:hypothetical protein